MSRETPPDFAGMLTEVGVDGNTADPTASVGDSRFSRSDRSMEMVAQPQLVAEVTLESKIGDGETTEVHLGTQRSMRRKVAVRKVHQHHGTAAAPGHVLSEAWMLGAFEHANILPVYAVTKDADGLPLVMMKAIETEPWTAVLETPEHPLGCPRNADPLAFNVQRMILVCSALEHAHHRGCIHRDVKPDNVLIGRDGSVYLHGWDLAVALEVDPMGRFPLAADQTQIAGTPAYMAPEMATRNAAELGPTTDVYLVGASLHEVVTGLPRHIGENVFDAFYSAVASVPFDYEPDVPAELALLLNKAMATRPRDRFQTMVELRHALEAFLRHRPSERLTRQALQAHEQFSRAVESKVDDFVVRELFASTFTAYGSARHFWSRNPVVNENLELVIREMIGYEIEHGAADRAHDLLLRLKTPAPDLEERINHSTEFPTIPRARLPAPTVAPVPKVVAESPGSRRDRVTLMGGAVAIWSAFGFAFAVMETFADIVITRLQLAIVASVAWLVLGGFVALRRRSLFHGVVAGPILGPFAVIAAGSVALQLSGAAQTPHQLVASHLLLFFVAMAMLNVWLDWRLVLSSAVYFVAYVLAAHSPQYSFWLMGASNLIALGFAGYIIHQRISTVSA